MAKTVLIVDDSDDARELMRLMIEMLGQNVIEAADGSEAVEIAKNNGLDLILMDIAMPQMDGIEATKRIKQIKEAADIPIVMVTAHSQKYQSEALEAGAYEIVSKPVDFDDLKPLLSNYLSV